jgi:hypothetical protein
MSRAVFRHFDRRRGGLDQTRLRDIALTNMRPHKGNHIRQHAGGLA